MEPFRTWGVETVGESAPNQYQNLSIEKEVPQPIAADVQPGQIGLSQSAKIHRATVIQNIPLNTNQIPKRQDQGPILSTSPESDLSTNTVPIDSCQQIPQSGTPIKYVLTANLSASLECLVIKNSTDITIDCQGHSITSPLGATAIDIQNGTRITVENCSLGTGFMEDSSNLVSLINNHFESVSISNSQNGQIDNNQFVTTAFSAVQLTGCSHTSVMNNSFQNKSVFGESAIDATGGHDNFFASNQIDGGWDGDPLTYYKVGWDDGIVLTQENADCIKDNTIHNCWDTSIETTGPIDGLKISHNSIHTVGVTAIGAWWNNSWNNVTIENNDAADTPAFLVGTYEQGPAVWGSIPSVVHYSNVTVGGNTLTSPRPPSPISLHPYINMAVYLNIPSSFPAVRGNPTASDVENVVFKNNRFDISIAGPYVDPPGSLTDGGGNVWGTPPTGPVPFLKQGATPQAEINLRLDRFQFQRKPLPLSSGVLK